MTKILQVILVLAAITITACKADAQKKGSKTIPFTALLQMLADQPDHIADRTIIVNDTIIQIKFAKKQDKSRHEFYPLDQAENLKNTADKYYKMITILQPQQPSIGLDPQEKTHTELPSEFNLVPFDIDSFLKDAASEISQITVEDLGLVAIDGHEANKIRMKFEGEASGIYFYFAKDLKNLFIRMDSDPLKGLKASYSVSNVSFDVGDELFQVPKNYKKVDFNSFISRIKQKALK